MADVSDRLKFPFIAPGQAQKEVTHNEALALGDMLIQPVVQSVAPVAVPTNPAIGQCWIVGIGTTGAWAGHDGALACWSAGGWRFAAPFEGMSVWCIADTMYAIRSATAWVIGTVNARQVQVSGVQLLTTRQASIAPPSGGTVIDSESRIALAAILAMLRIHGLIAT